MSGCSWCLMNEKMKHYHDIEWRVPVHNDYKQFEFLMMEVMQCGLNWNMMLQKREIFRECFDGFDYEKVARYTDDDIERIINIEGMIRSERKIKVVIHNVKCFQELREEFGSFSDYIWNYTDGKMVLYTGHEKGRVPAKNGLSDKIARDLKKRGFKYLGSVTVYAHLQASGMINDYGDDCERYGKLIDSYPTVTKRRYKES